MLAPQGNCGYVLSSHVVLRWFISRNTLAFVLSDLLAQAAVAGEVNILLLRPHGRQAFVGNDLPLRRGISTFTAPLIRRAGPHIVARL